MRNRCIIDDWGTWNLILTTSLIFLMHLSMISVEKQNSSSKMWVTPVVASKDAIILYTFGLMPWRKAKISDFIISLRSPNLSVAAAYILSSNCINKDTRLETGAYPVQTRRPLLYPSLPVCQRTLALCPALDADWCEFFNRFQARMSSSTGF